MDINKLKTAELREMAEKQEIKGWEDMEKEDLLKALQPKEESEEPETPEEEPEEDISKLPIKELKKIAKEKGVDIKGLRSKKAIAEAIKKSDDKDGEPETPAEETPKKIELSAGITEEHVPVGSKAELMKIQLAKQPKVRILIPIEGKEKPGTTEPFILNGYRLNVAKGVYVDVPEQIAEMVVNSQKQTMEALNNPLNLANPQHPKKQSGEGIGSLDV